MIVKKVRKIVNEKLSEYPIMENQIKELKSQLGSAPICKDVNSFIKSKGKTSNLTEGIAIHDIEIEERIEEYIKWKNLIDSIYDDFKKNDKIKGAITLPKGLTGVFEYEGKTIALKSGKNII